MAINCDPKALADAAKCFQSCIPAGMQPAVQTYLLAVIAGGSLDPKVLLAAATTPGKSFLVLEGVQQEVQAYLLCQIASASGA